MPHKAYYIAIKAIKVYFHPRKEGTNLLYDIIIIIIIIISSPGALMEKYWKQIK